MEGGKNAKAACMFIHLRMLNCRFNVSRFVTISSISKLSSKNVFNRPENCFETEEGKVSFGKVLDFFDS